MLAFNSEIQAAALRNWLSGNLPAMSGLPTAKASVVRVHGEPVHLRSRNCVGYSHEKIRSIPTDIALVSPVTSLLCPPVLVSQAQHGTRGLFLVVLQAF